MKRDCSAVGNSPKLLSRRSAGDSFGAASISGLKIILVYLCFGGSILHAQIPFGKSQEEAYMRPLWEKGTTINETVLLISEHGEAPHGRLLYEPEQILSVRDFCLKETFVEGKDFTVKGRILTALNPNLPHFLETRKTNLGKTYKYSVFNFQQVAVTYTHKDKWEGYRTTWLGNNLPETMQCLKQGHLKVVAFGDSISKGFGQSGEEDVLPGMPAWATLACNEVARKTGAKIELINTSVGGIDSTWGASTTKNGVTEQKPDLVLLHFGQNDFWYQKPKAYANNITGMIAAAKHGNPKAEVILFAPMRFDPHMNHGTYWNAVGKYRKALLAMRTNGVEIIDMTQTSEELYQKKDPADFLVDSLHPNDYLARWYAQSLVAALVPPRVGESRRLAPNRSTPTAKQIRRFKAV